MTVERFVVVGASLAGSRAVEVARKAGFDGSITLIGAEHRLPYDRPPLSKAVLDDQGETPEIPFLQTQEVLTENLGVDLMLGSPATALDVGRNVVLVDEREVPYDRLIIATGSQARELPGHRGLAGVHSLRTLDDALAIRARLNSGAKTVVIGAGFVGSEVASAARKRGLDVTIIEASEQPLERAIGASMGAAVSALHARNGVELRTGVGVRAVEGDGAVERVLLTDGSELPADLVVVGIGAEPSVSWLTNSGLTLDNGIVCDEYLCAGVDGVYAAGDVARWHNPMFGSLQRLEHRSSAAEQGAVAARNALSPDLVQPYTTVPYFWSDWYDSRIQFVGSPTADEVRVVDGSVDGPRWVALFRAQDRLVGAFTVNGQAEAMRYRALIAKGASWSEGLHFAQQRIGAR